MSENHEFPPMPPASIDTCICERPMSGTGYDAFSVHWTNGHYTVGQEPIFDELEDWQEQLRIPDVEKSTGPLPSNLPRTLPPVRSGMPPC